MHARARACAPSILCASADDSTWRTADASSACRGPVYRSASQMSAASPRRAALSPNSRFRNLTLLRAPQAKRRRGASFGRWMFSANRQSGNDFLRRALAELAAVPEVAKLPLERVAELGLAVDAQLVLLLIANGARAKAVKYHLELCLRTGIRSCLRRRRKAPA